MAPRYVIIGASLAGATAAITLRDEGADGPVTLIGAERESPYERPPLSKAYLRGDVPFDKALVRPRAFYAEHGIETMFGTSVSSRLWSCSKGAGFRWITASRHRKCRAFREEPT